MNERGSQLRCSRIVPNESMDSLPLFRRDISLVAKAIVSHDFFQKFCIKLRGEKPL